MDTHDKNETLIRDMSEDQRPREKALKYGLKSLNEAELMAIIFATGIKGKSVLKLCEEILDDNGGHISKVTSMSVKQLCARYKGIGQVKAITLLAALELGAKAALDDQLVKNDIIRESRDAYNAMRHRLERLQHEEFWILLIDRGGHIIRDVCISKGGTVATTVDLKLILKAAIENLASSILLFHNHPSGTLRPSVEDDKLTKKIVEAARMIDIRVNDHLIITNSDYYSYMDNGRL